MRKILHVLSDMLYPRRCPLCDGLLSGNEKYTCTACAETLRFIREPVCARCGCELKPRETEICRECGKDKPAFQSGFAPFRYRDIQSSILRMKYGGRMEYAAFYAEMAVRFGWRKLQKWQPQLIIPIPIHRRRYLKRGYNQAELLAEELGKRLCIPVRNDLLRRDKNTRPQSGLGRKERRENLLRAFSVRGSEELPERVLLVDDIKTTGSTLDAAAGLLLEHGARSVYYAAACISEEKDFTGP